MISLKKPPVEMKTRMLLQKLPIITFGPSNSFSDVVRVQKKSLHLGQKGNIIFSTFCTDTQFPDMWAAL